MNKNLVLIAMISMFAIFAIAFVSAVDWSWLTGKTIVINSGDEINLYDGEETTFEIGNVEYKIGMNYNGDSIIVSIGRNGYNFRNFEIGKIQEVEGYPLKIELVTFDKTWWNQKYRARMKITKIETVCGNAICEKWEDSQNCLADCPLLPPLKSNGEVCIESMECQSNYCDLDESGTDRKCQQFSRFNSKVTYAGVLGLLGNCEAVDAADYYLNPINSSEEYNCANVCGYKGKTCAFGVSLFNEPIDSTNKKIFLRSCKDSTSPVNVDLNCYCC